MKADLLTYYKDVLSRISHVDRCIFRKELRKAFRALLPDQRHELKTWFRMKCVCKRSTSVNDPAHAGASFN